MFLQSTRKRVRLWSDIRLDDKLGKEFQWLESDGYLMTSKRPQVCAQLLSRTIF